jgi:hypothetical protein
VHVIRRPLTANARFRSQSSPCGISGDKVQLRQAFVSVLWDSLVTVIPPIFHSKFHSCTTDATISRQKRASLYKINSLSDDPKSSEISAKKCFSRWSQRTKL